MSTDSNSPGEEKRKISATAWILGGMAVMYLIIFIILGVTIGFKFAASPTATETAPVTPTRREATEAAPAATEPEPTEELTLESPVITDHWLQKARSGTGLVITQVFAFYDPDGDAYVIDYELISSSESVTIGDGEFGIALEQQIAGTTVSGTWECGSTLLRVTLRASIVDRAGHRSNWVEYELTCD